MPDTKKLWDEALLEIELIISKANFTTWFKNTHICHYDDGVVNVSVPNEFVKEWMLTKYHKCILKALRDKHQSVRSVDFVIQKDEDKQRPQKLMIQDEALYSDQMHFPELYVSKEDNLNPKYTFETLVIGPFNELAVAASQSVLKNLGTTYNPLFIYGGTGLGKTHLIQAIGNQLKKNDANKKIFYITSERWATDLVDSIRNNKIHLFKEKYRKYDLLIIDDIQFISGKDKTEEELFHLFNSYHDNNKQIIFSSDKPPRAIIGLEERLRTRFEGGMMVDISQPEYETRLEILRTKAKGSHIMPPEDVLEYLATSIQDSVRELEGALNLIVVQSQVKNRALSVQEAKNLIKNNLKPQKTISLKDVIRVVAEFYNIEEKILYEKSRRKEIVKPRQIIMYILREDFNTSYPYIGQKMGGRDHTTVIHAYEKIKRDLKIDQLLGQEMEQIKTILYKEYRPV
ncbi:MAG: chromosomal replication initiator protein DnaA [Candidatus Paceibacterota bacterium]|jgi:chromosomal replication initiator protein